MARFLMFGKNSSYKGRSESGRFFDEINRDAGFESEGCFYNASNEYCGFRAEDGSLYSADNHYVGRVDPYTNEIYDADNRYVASIYED